MAIQYGFCFDKQGNLKVVYAPLQNGHKVSNKIKTKTGALHDSVGFTAASKENSTSKK